MSGLPPVRILKPLLLALALMAPAAAAEAHPHIWIRATATLQFESGKITGILHEWVFDDFFSNALIADFDKNKISVTSPIGKALMGKKSGEVLKIKVPAGFLEYKILDVTR